MAEALRDALIPIWCWIWNYLLCSEGCEALSQFNGVVLGGCWSRTTRKIALISIIIIYFFFLKKILLLQREVHFSDASCVSGLSHLTSLRVATEHSILSYPSTLRRLEIWKELQAETIPAAQLYRLTQLTRLEVMILVRWVSMWSHTRSCSILNFLTVPSR